MAPMASSPVSPDRPEATGSLPDVPTRATGEAAAVGCGVSQRVLRSPITGGFVPAFSTVGTVGIWSFGGGFW